MSREDTVFEGMKDTKIRFSLESLAIEIAHESDLIVRIEESINECDYLWISTDFFGIGRDEDDAGYKGFEHFLLATTGREKEDNPRRDILEELEETIPCLKRERIDPLDDEDIVCAG